MSAPWRDALRRLVADGSVVRKARVGSFNIRAMMDRKGIAHCEVHSHTVTICAMPTKSMTTVGDMRKWTGRTCPTCYPKQ